MTAPLSRSVTTELTTNCPGVPSLGFTSTSMPRDAEGVGGGAGILAVAPRPKPANTARERIAPNFIFIDASIDWMVFSTTYFRGEPEQPDNALWQDLEDAGRSRRPNKGA